jgi:hypothetical protein
MRRRERTRARRRGGGGGGGAGGGGEGISLGAWEREAVMADGGVGFWSGRGGMGNGGVCVGTESGNFVFARRRGGRRPAARVEEERMYVLACEEERSVRPATVMD